MTFTFVSNGHGEDAIGARLASLVLRAVPDARVAAYPIVGDGAAYAAHGVATLGPRRTLPSGGLTLHAWANLRADLRAGLVAMTARQLVDLAALRSDAIVVVGDVYAQLLAAPARSRRRFVVQPLVSVLHGQGGDARDPRRYFMEHIAYPERALLRHRATRVYLRDEATAAYLRACGVRGAVCLGNPMVDMALGRPIEAARREAGAGAVVACLPGTRAYAPHALQRMAAALARCGDAVGDGRPAPLGLVAWSGGALPRLEGWETDETGGAVAGRVRALRRGAARLWLVEGRFGDVLASADVALGTAGTGNEQAAALGLPVVSFPLEPLYTRAFLRNQRRLLGEALTLAEPDPAAVAAALATVLRDDARRRSAAATGRSRMGPPGGSEAIVNDLLAILRAG